MGTRALIHVHSEGRRSKTLTTIYTQYDGYPSGIGDDIKRLGITSIINGFGIGDNSDKANGMGCYAAQLVSHLKEGIGTIYLYPPNTKDVWEEYTYHIWTKSGSVYIEVKDGERIWKGLLSEFDGEAIEANQSQFKAFPGYTSR